jgi:hypothetical protein
MHTHTHTNIMLLRCNDCHVTLNCEVTGFDSHLDVLIFKSNLLLLLLLPPIQGLSPLTRSEAKGIVVSISFLDAQCPVFQ